MSNWLRDMSLEIVPVRVLLPPILNEIEKFLSSQQTGHPFQHPMWSLDRPDEYCIFSRDSGQLKFFALCGTQYPLGRRVSRIRALTMLRGPVCDDQGYMLGALAQLIIEAKTRGFIYVEISPDWIDPAAQDLGSLLVDDGGPPSVGRDAHLEWTSLQILRQSGALLEKW